MTQTCFSNTTFSLNKYLHWFCFFSNWCITCIHNSYYFYSGFSYVLHIHCHSYVHHYNQLLFHTFHKLVCSSLYIFLVNLVQCHNFLNYHVYLDKKCIFVHIANCICSSSLMFSSPLSYTSAFSIASSRTSLYSSYSLHTTSIYFCFFL